MHRHGWAKEWIRLVVMYAELKCCPLNELLLLSVADQFVSEKRHLVTELSDLNVRQSGCLLIIMAIFRRVCHYLCYTSFWAAICHDVRIIYHLVFISIPGSVFLDPRHDLRHDPPLINFELLCLMLSASVIIILNEAISRTSSLFCHFIEGCLFFWWPSSLLIYKKYAICATGIGTAHPP